MPRSELDILQTLSETQGSVPTGETHIGDDAAVVLVDGVTILITTDAIVEGVHVDSRWCSPTDIGWKSVMVNVSDIAAMGGVPTACVISIAGPPETDVLALVEGARLACETLGISVVGGDLSQSATLVVNVTAIGHAQRPVLRSSAGAGDALWVSGDLGGSSAGLRILRRDPTDLSALAQRHRRPRARTDIAVRLAEIGATAMMDISDGLLLDAHRMATASNLGIELVEIPIVTGATEDDALSGGEDYELLFSVAESDLVANDLLALGCRQIGRLVADSRVRVLRGHTFEPSGWSHHW